VETQEVLRRLGKVRRTKMLQFLCKPGCNAVSQLTDLDLHVT
jgi:hypothetical protein